MSASDLIWVMAGVGIGLVASMAALSLLVALDRRRLGRRVIRRRGPPAVPIPVGEQIAAVSGLLAALPPKADSTDLPSDDRGPASVHHAGPSEELRQEAEPPAFLEPHLELQATPAEPTEADAASVPAEPPEPVPPVEEAEKPLTVEGLFAEAFRAEVSNGDLPPAAGAPTEWRPAKPRSQQND